MIGRAEAGRTDLHSHLVPGVDDGSRTLEEALEGIGKLRSSGVTHIVTTPHLDGSLTHDPGALAQRLEEVDEAWAVLLEGAGQRYPDVELRRGHEVKLDVPDPDLSDLRLHLHHTPFVLVEWSGLQVPPATLRVLNRMEGEGIRPVIAHPERYRGLDRDLRLPGEWRQAGALLQVNYGSLVGRYGSGAQEGAMTLLERGWVDLFSTDFHGRPHLSPLLEEAGAELAKAGGADLFELLSKVNTSRLWRGDDPLPAPTFEARRGVLDRVLSIFQRTGGSEGP